MKNIFLTVAVLFSIIAQGQQTEIRVSLDSGLFSYAGNGTSSSGVMNTSYGTFDGFVENPYGSKGGLSYGLSLDARHINENKAILGVSLGYQVLRSSTEIHTIAGDFQGLPSTDFIFITQVRGDGNTHLTNYTVNLFPYYGRRLDTDISPIDILLGIDIAYILGTTNKGSVEGVTLGTFTTNENFFTESFDFRPRLQVSTDYKDFGLYIGYSLGLVNFKAPSEYYYENAGEAKTRIFRFGVTYKLK
jgi:hypothetical protein